MLVHQEELVTKAPQELMAKMAWMASLVLLDHQETEESLVKMVFLDYQAWQEKRVRQEIQDLQECLVTKAPQENKATLDFRDQRVQGVGLVQLDQ